MLYVFELVFNRPYSKIPLFTLFFLGSVLERAILTLLVYQLFFPTVPVAVTVQVGDVLSKYELPLQVLVFPALSVTWMVILEVLVSVVIFFSTVFCLQPLPPLSIQFAWSNMSSLLQELVVFEPVTVQVGFVLSIL